MIPIIKLKQKNNKKYSSFERLSRRGKGFLIGSLCLLLCHDVVAQNTIGLPNVVNFTEQDFNAGVQNWMIRQDKNGIMYFANNDGLLTYNGKSWRLYPLPNKTLVRSIKIATDGKIYVGGQDEFGYYFPQRNGKLLYHSLKKLLPQSERSFTDVWNTVMMGDTIFFRCTDRIFCIDKNHKVQIYKAPLKWDFMSEVNGILYAQDSKQVC